MWIYESSGTEPTVMPAPLPERTDLPAVSPAEIEERNLSAACPEPRPPQSENRPAAAPCRTAKSCPATRDCVLLAAAFLLGSIAAGVLQAVCDARQTEVLGYYLDAWRALFAAESLQNTVHLFCAEYLTLGIVVSLFLILGFSALGPLLIFGCTMLYGLGSGLLLVQLSNAGGWRVVLPVLVWTGIPAALAGGCLCLFGASALQVSGRIRAYSFRAHSAGQAGPGVRALLGQYLLTMVLLLPLCGAAAGLSCLGSRF